MLDYSNFKTNFFKDKIKDRKKELGYLTPKKNTLGVKCQDGCAYWNALSPYMNRCSLISFDDCRTASISLDGGCNEFSKDMDKTKFDKYDNIEHDKIDAREVITAFREANG